MGLKRRHGQTKTGLDFKHKKELSQEEQIRLKYQRMERELTRIQEQKGELKLERNEMETVSVSSISNRKLILKTRKILPVEQSEEYNSEKNSRCVSVDTISPAPEGRREKKERFKGKNQLVKFRCSTYEKKLLTAKAKLCGLSLSEFLRRTAMEQATVERLTDEEIELYKMLAKYHNNFKSIGNMFRGKNENLTKMVYDTAKEIKEHLKKFSK